MLREHHTRPMLAAPVDVAAILAEHNAREARVLTEASQPGRIPVQTVVRGNCRNCHGELSIDVIFVAPQERPSVTPVTWELAGHFSHVECRHCSVHLSIVDLEEEGLDEAVQDVVRVLLRATPRIH